MSSAPTPVHLKLVLAYDGTAYHGWQVQPALPSIQGELARALHSVTGEAILPQASGRTDAGVHALAQVVSFALHTPIPVDNLHRALNRALPPAIRIVSVEQVPPSFHARYNAAAKTYEYRIFNRFQSSAETICPPMLAPYAWNCPWRLDLSALQQAAAHILGEHDFASFAAVDPEQRDNIPTEAPRSEVSTAPVGTIRRIFSSSWTTSTTDTLITPQLPGALPALLIYRVRGSGFLHHMVRNLVGAFVDAGCGRISSADIPAILAARSRSAAGATAPAHGLFLVSVEYPSVERIL